MISENLQKLSTLFLDSIEIPLFSEFPLVEVDSI